MEEANLDRSHLQECLEGEKAARMAATEELQEGLISKEAAEKRAEALLVEKYKLESQMLQLLDHRAKEEDGVWKGVRTNEFVPANEPARSRRQLLVYFRYAT